MTSTAATMGVGAPAEKAKRPRARRADGWQRARQAALRGRGRQIATALHISYHTLQHELDDASRDPVRRVAERLHALRAGGASPDALYRYAGEILTALRAAILADPRPLPTLEQLEAAVDGDEDLTQLPAVLQPGPRARAARVDQLRRYIACAEVLAARYEAEDAEARA